MRPRPVSSNCSLYIYGTQLAQMLVRRRPIPERRADFANIINRNCSFLATKRLCP